MPEIPDVVPGEIIEPDDWGNPIRDRTVQRYATDTERDAEHPTPADGDLAFVATPPEFGILQVYDSGQWHEVVLSTGARMRGNFLIGDSSVPDLWSLIIGRDASGVAGEFRATISNAAATRGYTVLRGAVGAPYAETCYSVTRK